VAKFDAGTLGSVVAFSFFTVPTKIRLDCLTISSILLVASRGVPWGAAIALLVGRITSIKLIGKQNRIMAVLFSHNEEEIAKNIYFTLT
jgi:hypothetical protein